ncbi:hypothetical protein [Tardiphaga sp. vice278]|uniref:hypothetical protein n=1 Tax=Tardiphaga sp. vice278 TaxID=2592815 RepID=UPI00143D006D|nr:hypothetical protein [Tardiphaga sp. vice278]
MMFSIVELMLGQWLAPMIVPCAARRCDHVELAGGVAKQRNARREPGVSTDGGLA